MRIDNAELAYINNTRVLIRARAATFDYFKNRLIDGINRLIDRLIENISK